MMFQDMLKNTEKMFERNHLENLNENSIAQMYLK